MTVDFISIVDQVEKLCLARMNYLCAIKNLENSPLAESFKYKRSAAEKALLEAIIETDIARIHRSLGKEGLFDDKQKRNKEERDLS
jgi:hypothetical protein